MQKINVSTKMMGKFAGKWVVVDPLKDRIIAAAVTLKEIAPMVTRPLSDQRVPGTVPYSFLVPRKDEGPYILSCQQITN